MLVDWTAAHVAAHWPAYQAVSADVSPWGEREFTSDLPGKFELSFGFWSDRPIGYCVISRKFGPPHVHQFMVERAHRGRGIGQIMLKAAEARGARTLKVDQANAAAIRFYERSGWKIVRVDGQYLWMRAQP